MRIQSLVIGLRVKVGCHSVAIGSSWSEFMNSEQYNDGNVVDFISNRFDKGFDREEEKWTFFSFIDNYLKQADSRKNTEEIINQIMEVCRRNGYVPQYNVSGRTVFPTKGSFFSEDSKYILTPVPGGIMVTFSGAVNPYALFHCPNDKDIRSILVSSNARYLSYVCINRDGYTVVIWNTDDFSIVHKEKSSLPCTFCSKTEKIYYVNAEWKLVCFDGSLETITDAIFDENDVKIAVNEDTGKVLVIGDSTWVIDIKGNGQERYEQMSADSVIHVTDEGFTILSAGILYSIDGKLKTIGEISAPVVTAESTVFNTAIMGCVRDHSGFYLLNGNVRYYLNSEGIQKVAIFKNDTRISQYSIDLLDDYSEACVPECIDMGPEQRVQYLREQLENGFHVVFTDRNGIVRVAVPKIADNRVQKVDVFQTGIAISGNVCSRLIQNVEYPFLDYVSELTVTDVFNGESVDVELLKTYAEGDYYINDTLMGYDCDVRSVIVGDLEAVYKLILLTIDQDNMFEIIEGDKHCLVARTDNTILTLCDGKVSFIEGGLINGYSFGKVTPVIKNGNVFRTLLSDGSVKDLDIDSDANRITTAGDAVLWRSGDGKWFRNRTDVSKFLDSNESYVLVSENTAAKIDSNKAVLINLDDGNLNVIEIKNYGFWHTMGKSDKGFVSFAKCEFRSGRMTIHFAELNMKTGAFNELNGELVIDIPMNPRFDKSVFPGTLYDILDYRKQKAIVSSMDYSDPRIRKFDLSKGTFRESHNGLRSNATKMNLQLIPLPDGQYLIATTGIDEESLENKKTEVFRPRSEIRIMNSATGMRKKNGSRSGGIMYGPPGVEIKPYSDSILVSPDSKYVLCEYYPQSIINSFELDSQKSYPENPITGRLLGFDDDCRVVIGQIDDDGSVKTKRLYDCKLNPLSEPEPMQFSFVYQNYELNESDGRIRYAYGNYVKNEGTVFSKNVLPDGSMDYRIEHIKFGSIIRSWKAPVDLPLPEETYGVTDIVKCTSTENLATLVILPDDCGTKDSTYTAYILVGDKQVRIKIANPLIKKGDVVGLFSPIFAEKSTVCYASRSNGKTSISLYNVKEDGSTERINTIDLGNPLFVPWYADSKLLIAVREDGGVFYSEDWENMHSVTCGKNIHTLSSYASHSERRGIHRFRSDINKSNTVCFFKGKMWETFEYNRPREGNLSIDTGELQWRNGIVTLKTN